MGGGVRKVRKGSLASLCVQQLRVGVCVCVLQRGVCPNNYPAPPLSWTAFFFGGGDLFR